MLEVVEGDLLKADVDVIFHQCNCKGKMGAGLAVQIATQYPEAYKADLEYELPFDDSRLGSFSYVRTINKYTQKPLIIVNIYGQDNYRGSGRKTDYNALHRGILKAINYFKENYSESFTYAMPYKIGCALGGGDWDIVYLDLVTIVQETKVNLTLYKYNP